MLSQTSTWDRGLDSDGERIHEQVAQMQVMYVSRKTHSRKGCGPAGEVSSTVQFRLISPAAGV